MDSYNIDKKYAVHFKTDSKGSQPKFLKDEFWYKINHVGNEGLAEELVSKVLSCSNIENYVEYEQCIINGKKGCRSESFLKEDEIFVTFQKLYQNYVGGQLINKINSISNVEDRFQYLVDFIKESTKLDITRYLQNNFSLDMLIMNPDRHYHNLGVIVNSEGKFREAPIFDNGQGLYQNFIITPPLYTPEEKDKRLVAASISGSFESQVQASGNFLKIDFPKLELILDKYEDSIAKECLENQLLKYKTMFAMYPESSLYNDIMNGEYNSFNRNENIKDEHSR